MDAIDLGFYRHQGHVTINGVFSAAAMDAVVADIEAWGETFLAALPKEQRAWYVDGGVQAKTVLRKLDNPHAHRAKVQAIARDTRLVALVEQVLGAGVSVYFSQIFFKPPEGGGPKPAHQDNFYFGPSDLEGIVTAWIALDDATLENGCLYFGDGTNAGPVYPHVRAVRGPADHGRDQHREHRGRQPAEVGPHAPDRDLRDQHRKDEHKRDPESGERPPQRLGGRRGRHRHSIPSSL